MRRRRITEASAVVRYIATKEVLEETICKRYHQTMDVGMNMNHYRKPIKFRSGSVFKFRKHVEEKCKG